MKRLIIPILTLLLVSCIPKNEKEAISSGQELYFAESTYDFGEMMEDGPGTHKIEFKNIGEEPVVINRVRSSCGCTIPSWPKAPIEPGSTGEIEVKYNTALVGPFRKTVYIYSTAVNTPVKIMIKGKVFPKDKTQ
ncbi:MAG: DUF1573 domain-containing protein [Bacteroidales bacterium]